MKSTAGAALTLSSMNTFAHAETVKEPVKGMNNRKKPNVVLICCDQLRSFSLGCYGNKSIKTPNIDKLAKEGFLFGQAVTNSPVCVPGRSNLLSGQYARTCVGSRCNEMTENMHFGRSDRSKFPDSTLPEEFKKLGYKTSLIGKWHVDTRPSLFGFDESLIAGDIFSRASFFENEGEEFRVQGFSPDYEISSARTFFSDNKEQPFFLYYNIIAPHMPLLDVPYKYSHMYNPDRVPLRDNVWKDGKLGVSEVWFNIYMWQTFYNAETKPITAKATPDFTVKDLTALYYGAVSWVDDIVGEVLKSLKENGLEEDTIVLFVSDHGDMLGSHHRWNKDCLYEEAIRVPMIYRWLAAVKHDTNDKQITSLIDVMPTLLELCGGEIPGSVQGRSMASFLLGTAEKECLENNYAFIETPFAELGIRTPTHLYGVEMRLDKKKGIENDKHLFYDLTKDQYQQNNLVDQNVQTELAKELREKLIAWDENTPCLDTIDYMSWQGRYPTE
ncbi:MAG: sulfatase-like hydrolase/transferase [Sedimentisphaeraceae bacterium JB056]